MAEAQETKATFIQENLRDILPFLGGLDAAAHCNADNPVMAGLMIETGIDALIALGTDRKRGSALATSQGDALEQHYLRVIQDEKHARTHLGFEPLPHAPSVLENFAAGVERITSRVDSLVEQLQPKVSPLFSVAADKYIKKLKDARGDSYVGARALQHHRDVFLAIMIDKPVQHYTEDDFQEFINEAHYLPNNYARGRNYSAANIKLYIAENKVAKKVGLAVNTLLNGYLAGVKTVIREGCRSVGMPYSLAGIDVLMPKDAPLPRQQIPPDYASLQRLFQAGKDTGVLADLMLPLLGFLTGRRLAILVNLRGEDIIRYHGRWVVAPKSVVIVDGDTTWPCSTWCMSPAFACAICPRHSIIGKPTANDRRMSQRHVDRHEIDRASAKHRSRREEPNRVGR